MIGIRLLRSFQTVSEELNFRRAAERLHLAQPALSRQIQQLERDVGTLLLKRSPRSVELTPAGRVYLDRIVRVLQDLDKAAVDARRASAGEYGRLRIGFMHSSTFGLMPSLVAHFRQSYPDVEVDLREMTISEQINALRADVIDVGLLRNPIDNPELVTRDILAEPFLIAVPSSHPLAQAGTIALQDVKQDPFIFFSIESNPLFHARILSICQKQGFLPNVVQFATQVHTALGWVGAGMGVALVPEVARNLRIAGVQLLEIEGSPVRLDVALAWRRSNESPIIRSFLETAAIIAAEMAEARRVEASSPMPPRRARSPDVPSKARRDRRR